MTRGSAAGGFAIRVPFVDAGPTPLRLSDGLAALRGATDGVAADEGLLTGLQGALALHCDVWRRGQRRFLECYFDFVERHVDEHRDELAARLEPFGRLFRVGDWRYAALMPLPRAFLHAPEAGEPFGPETLIPVDFAFWTGRRAIAVELTGAGSAGAAERRRARLRRAGIAVAELTDDLFDADRADRFEAALPEDLRYFWRGQALPSGPLAPVALDVAANEI